jgi:hypothetical protein
VHLIDLFPIFSDNYYIFAAKMFEKQSNIQLQNMPQTLKEGMQKNVRYVGDDIKSAVPMLQVDRKLLCLALFCALKVSSILPRSSSTFYAF